MVKKKDGLRKKIERLGIWLPLVSLVIALFGGVPGFFGIYAALTSGPELIGKVEFMNFGLLGPSDGYNYCSVFMHITLTNAGDEPLTPNGFQTFFLFDNDWVKFRNPYIDSNLIIDNQTSIDKISIDNLYERDILKMTSPIAKGIPIRGILLGINEDIGLYEKVKSIEILPIKIICTDIFGNEHIIRQDFVIDRQKVEIFDPTQGLRVKPKK